MTSKPEGDGPSAQRVASFGRWFLGLVVFSVGFGCQEALRHLYPYTGLGAILTFPLTWLLSLAAAVGFVALSRGMDGDRTLALFVSVCLAVCATAIYLYPQDSGTSAWVLLWRSVSGS